jgi:hypothetical protein
MELSKASSRVPLTSQPNTVADMIFIGPNDLASSMGYVPFDHPGIPDVQEAAAHVLKATLAAGKYAGHLCVNAEEGMFVCMTSRSYTIKRCHLC